MSVRVSDPSPNLQVHATRRGPAWAKLFSLAIVFNALGVATATYVAVRIRAIPDTDALDQGLRAAYYVAMALAAIFDALLLDEVIFKGAFRRTHLAGRVPGVPRSDDEIEGAAVSMQRSTISFPMLLLAAGLATSMVFDLTTNNFTDYYRDVGRYLGELRRGDEARQLAAIEALSIRRSPEIVPALRWRVSQGGRPAAWAAWALGRHADEINKRPLIPPLVAGARSDDAGLRRESIVALGRLQQRSMAGEIQDEIAADLDAGGPVDARLVYGLGVVQVTSSRTILERLLQTGDPLAQRLAAWAVAQHRDQRGGRDMVHLLEDRLPTADVELRCAIVHGLAIMAHERSNLALVRAYDDATSEELAFVCPRIRLSLAPADVTEGTDVAELLVPEDALALQILAAMGQMRATTPEIRAVVEPWLERRVVDPTATVFVQEAARALLGGIREARDDSKKPSVEEALRGQRG